jgi:dipeptidyl-peptidase-3
MKKIIFMLTTSLLLAACTGNQNKADTTAIECDLDLETFQYQVDRFADIEILRYPVLGFNSLSLQQKQLIYFLSQAALEGRDILWDQHNRYNLTIRRVCESIYENFMGNRNTEDWQHFETYLKQIWFHNGIHHGTSEEKIMPKFSQEYFIATVRSVDPGRMPFRDGMAAQETLDVITPVMFNPNVMSRRMNQAAGADLVATSAVNFYEGVTQKEVEDFYNAMKNPNDPTPVSFGLNSKVVKVDGVITEQVWKVGGMYDRAITRIVNWLEQAAEVAENNAQRDVINTLIEYYRTGSLKTFDEYSIKWVSDLDSRIDFLNGFIEVYTDPLGMKGTWEALVNFKSTEASKRTIIISDNAQWFEDNAPIDDRFKKDEVVGISAKVVTVAQLGGDLFPGTAIGINLPNSNWIRRDHGSKSVTMDNIMLAYTKASESNGFAEEFMWNTETIELSKKYGGITDLLHVDLHETIGHGSGKLLSGTDVDALRAYGSPIEEARADLMSLYFMADPKMVDFGLLPHADAYKAQYYKYIMNGAITQLTRVQLGRDIEQAHMRGRAMISNWVLDKGKADNVVELAVRDGKTFFVINNYEKLRTLLGELLAEVQRIKSEGDFEAGKNLIENYGVKVDRKLHEEILTRHTALNLAISRGFVNPAYSLVTDANGNITDVTISYDEDFKTQQLRYSRQFSVLPLMN